MLTGVLYIIIQNDILEKKTVRFERGLVTMGGVCLVWIRVYKT